MSVIVKDLQTGDIELLCKGADSMIKKRLDLDDPEIAEYMQQTQLHVNSYANEGLRTLLLARKSLDSKAYADWDSQYQKALCLVEGKDEQVEKLQDQIENDLRLVGSTAIEDKL